MFSVRALLRSGTLCSDSCEKIASSSSDSVSLMRPCLVSSFALSLFWRISAILLSQSNELKPGARGTFSLGPVGSGTLPGTGDGTSRDGFGVTFDKGFLSLVIGCGSAPGAGGCGPVFVGAGVGFSVAVGVGKCCCSCCCLDSGLSSFSSSFSISFPLEESS